MFPIREFEKRFREILAQLDELRDAAEDADTMEELNAEFEDALFVIECADPNEEEWQEEFEDALEEFDDLCESYEVLKDSALEDTIQRLRMTISMARANLN